MISAFWLIPTAMVGAIIGIMVMCLMMIDRK